MDEFNINITEPAENDLRDIAKYISSQLNAPEAALNIIREIRKTLLNLKENALIYPYVRDDRLATLGYRSVTTKNYTSFYVIYEKENKVYIDRILYSRRDWKNII